MIISELWQQILLAVIGGLAVELLHWWKLAREGKPIRAYAKKSLYWLTTLGMILVGGLMPVLYLQGTASALLCFHLGAATPLLLAKLASSIPPNIQPQGSNRSQAQTSLSDFLDW